MNEKKLFLEKVNKDPETFTFISGHDLQEPLRKVKIFISCLLEEEAKSLSGPGKDYLNRMESAVSRMQLLIDDLPKYAGAEKGMLDFENLILVKLPGR